MVAAPKGVRAPKEGCGVLLAPKEVSAPVPPKGACEGVILPPPSLPPPKAGWTSYPVQVEGDSKPTSPGAALRAGAGLPGTPPFAAEGSASLVADTKPPAEVAGLPDCGPDPKGDCVVMGRGAAGASRELPVLKLVVTTAPGAPSAAPGGAWPKAGLAKGLGPAFGAPARVPNGYRGEAAALAPPDEAPKGEGWEAEGPPRDEGAAATVVAGAPASRLGPKLNTGLLAETVVTLTAPERLAEVEAKPAE